MTAVERILDVCKKRGIPISRIERDLGFSNQYLTKLKKGDIPLDRAEKAAGYLGLPVEWILKGDERKGTELLISPQQNPTTRMNKGSGEKRALHTHNRPGFYHSIS